MKDFECPYCNCEIEITHDDGFGLDESKIEHYECPDCEKAFIFTTSITINHTAHVADCLNDGQHDFYETITYPKKYTKLQCRICGTKQELPAGHDFLKEDK